MSRLLILDPRGPDNRDVIEAALDRGHEVFSISHPGRSMDGVPDAISDNTVVDFSAADVPQILDSHIENRGINGVITTREYLTPLVARLCAAHGLPGNNLALAVSARNKIAMADQFGRHQVAVPATFVVDREEQVTALVQDGTLSYPLVVKPAENAGSKGVSIVEGPGEVAEAIQRVRTQQGAFDLTFDPRVVVQEYIAGAEFSVESVTQAGRTTHVCITRKVTTHGRFRAEIGHSVPAVLDPRTEHNILTQASKAIAAVGICNSVSHTEVIVRPDGTCVVLEIAARTGAGRIGLLTKLALGVDMPAAAVDVALGVPIEIEPKTASFATVRLLLSPRAGHLVNLAHVPQEGGDVALVSQTAQVGSTVTGPQNNVGRIGLFIVTGQDEKAVNLRADELLSQVEITIEPEITADRSDVHARA